MARHFPGRYAIPRPGPGTTDGFLIPREGRFMRILFHYLFATLVLTIYGGQV